MAELIFAVETAQPSERPELQERCAKAILDLWSYRRELPQGRRPLEDVEPVLDVLRSLDLDDSAPRYGRLVIESIGDETLSPAVETWFDKVSKIDRAARVLIRHCLARAVGETLDKSRNWVQLAKDAELDDAHDVLALKIVIGDYDMIAMPSSDAAASQRLQQRIELLSCLSAIAAEVASELAARLEDETSQSDSESAP